jgi:A/G-specific adenine glycosylase
MQSEFALRLVDWQRTHGRNDLPWNQATATQAEHAYNVWLSEVMLQQTQVATVIPYFYAFKTRFPTLESLAYSDIDTVLALWAGLGYYSRARNLHRCAQQIMSQYDGIIPSNLANLTALPGIGPSTAAAIASLAYQQRAAILDGNVKRVLARHAAIVGWSGTRLVNKRLWQVAHNYLVQDKTIASLNHEHHRRYTQGLMDLGATVCHKRQPDCTICPVAQDCQSLAQDLLNTLPTPRPKRLIPIQSRSALIVYDDHGVWLERRPSSGLWGGLLSFPEAENDAALQALPLAQRHLLSPWTTPTLRHTFTHYQLHWRLWSMAVDARFTLPKPWQYIRWETVASSGVPKAVLKALTLK